MARRIFHVDLDAFFVAVERALDPSLDGKPVAVGGEPGGRGVVACASYEARAYGLKAGMPLTQALRLCPHAIFIPGRYSRYRDASEQFMRILREYSPFLEPLSVDEAFIDMTGFESLYGPLDGVAHVIKERIRKEVRVTASIGIASSKVTAKVASEQGKPDGLLEVSPGQDAAFLAPLSVRQLPGVGAKASQTLKGAGIDTVGQLAQVSPTVLRRIFGAWGDLLHLWANGGDDRPVAPWGAPKSISRETTLREDTLDMRFLRGILRYLGERVGASLRGEGKLARCVAVKMRYENFDTITRRRTFKEPTDTDAPIFKAGEQLLAIAMRQRRDKVRLLGIGVHDLTSSVAQLSLFRMESATDRSLTHAVDAIRSKHGYTSIQRGLTFALSSAFKEEDGHFILKTPALSQ